MNELADKLEMDPFELRQRNIIHEGDVMPAYYGQVNTSCALDRCLKTVHDRMDWDHKYPVREIGNGKVRAVVNGLAWTSVGGEILPIEVAVMEGTGKIELTGSLGDVMQESAKTAITCIRSHAAVLGIDSDFYKNKDIHIHAPEGAVPKDGPSAGITMATAIYSALTLKPARHDIAMTGEITLRGNVLPIGGLKEKSMAAFKNGITTVIIPKDNEPDLEDVDKAVLEKVKFIPVRNFSEVVALAVNNTVRITDNQWNGIDMTAVRSATKTVNAVKQ